MNLLILHAEEIDGQGRCVLSDDRAQHIRRVLNAGPGKVLRIGLLNGPLGTGAVEKVENHAVILKCEFEKDVPPVPRIDLLLAMPRPKVMKRLWAQLAAIGVGRIVLLRASKVERYYFDSHVLEPEFYTKLLIEGLQQARCTRLPDVLIRPLFKPFVEDELDVLFTGHLKLLADPSGGSRLHDIFPTGDEPERAVLAIGPEGGWTSYELELMNEHGFRLFGIGHRILRTDTAVISLIAKLAEYMKQPDSSG